MKKKEYSLKVCPKCGSNDIKVVLNAIGLWECNCSWKGRDVMHKKISKKEFIKFSEKLYDKDTNEDKN